MKPYLKVIINKIKLTYIKVIKCKQLKLFGYQLFSYNSKLLFSKKSSVYLGDKIINDGRITIIVDDNAKLIIGNNVYFNENNIYCLKLNSRNNSGIKQVNGLIMTACADKIERNKQRGILNRPIRAMVVGIPNVGKSTFINSYAGKASAKTGNKPGVTKGKQWIKLNKNVELLDTPGILWPKFDNQEVGKRLAMIGSMNDEILNVEELAIDTIKYIYSEYSDNVIERYGLDKEKTAASYDENAINPDNSVALYIMEQAAVKRGCIKKGNNIDYEKISNIILDDFRSGRLGRISLETP